MVYLSVIVFSRMLFCSGVRFPGQFPFGKVGLHIPLSGYILPRRTEGVGAMYLIFFFLLHSMFSDSVFLLDY